MFTNYQHTEHINTYFISIWTYFDYIFIDIRVSSNKYHTYIFHIAISIIRSRKQ